MKHAPDATLPAPSTTNVRARGVLPMHVKLLRPPMPAATANPVDVIAAQYLGAAALEMQFVKGASVETWTGAAIWHGGW